jgi:hypothetical protein
MILKKALTPYLPEAREKNPGYLFVCEGASARRGYQT